MDKDQIIKEIGMRAEAARQAYEKAERYAGPCETYFMRGQWIALQGLLEDIRKIDHQARIN